MLIQILLAKAQVYVGGTLGVGLLNRTNKSQYYKQGHQSDAESTDMSKDFLYEPRDAKSTDMSKDFLYEPPPPEEDKRVIKEIACNYTNWLRPHSQVGLKVGVNIPLARSWHMMLDSTLGLNALSGLNINAKATIRHRVGFFGGIGVELEHMWNLTHPTKTVYRMDGKDLPPVSESQRFLKQTPHGFSPLHQTLIYPLVSIGWQMALTKALALQFEGQALIRPGTKTPYAALLSKYDNKDLGDDTVLFKLQYGRHIKLRALTSLTIFI